MGVDFTMHQSLVHRNTHDEYDDVRVRSLMIRCCYYHLVWCYLLWTIVGDTPSICYYVSNGSGIEGDDLIAKLQKITSFHPCSFDARADANRHSSSPNSQEALPIHWWWGWGGIHGNMVVLRTINASLLHFASCRSLLKKISL